MSHFHSSYLLFYVILRLLLSFSDTAINLFFSYIPLIVLLTPLRIIVFLSLFYFLLFRVKCFLVSFRAGHLIYSRITRIKEVSLRGN